MLTLYFMYILVLYHITVYSIEYIGIVTHVKYTCIS